MVRDVLVMEVPTVLRAELYAVAALLGAAFTVRGQSLGLPFARGGALHDTSPLGAPLRLAPACCSPKGITFFQTNINSHRAIRSKRSILVRVHATERSSRVAIPLSQLTTGLHEFRLNQQSEMTLPTNHCNFVHQQNGYGR